MARSPTKRSAILAAAAAELREHGFQGASMDGIAARAGVSKRTVYGHFESKGALFDAIVKDLAARSSRALTGVYDPRRGLRAQLSALARQELALLADDEFRALARVVLSECFRSPELGRDLLARTERDEGALVSWIRGAAADGRLAVPDPRRAAGELTALLKAAAFWPQVLADAPPPSRGEARALVASAVRMFLAAYRPRRRAPASGGAR